MLSSSPFHLVHQTLEFSRLPSCALEAFFVSEFRISSQIGREKGHNYVVKQETEGHVDQFDEVTELKWGALGGCKPLTFSSYIKPGQRRGKFATSKRKALLPPPSTESLWPFLI